MARGGDPGYLLQKCIPDLNRNNDREAQYRQNSRSMGETVVIGLVNGLG